MRILIAGQNNNSSHNGQSVFTKNLAEGLVKQGHDVMLLLPSERKRAYREIVNGVHLATIDSINLRFIHPEVYYPPYPFPAIAKAMRLFQPQLLHIQDHYPVSWFCYLAARKRHIPVIGTNHFMPENLAPHAGLLAASKPLFNWIMWNWMLLLYNRLDHVTAPSKTALAILRAQGLKVNGSPISCGLDLDHFCPASPSERRAIRQRYQLGMEKKIFLFVGRVDGEKRLDVALHALSLLRRTDIQFAIAGIGTALDKLKKLSSQLGLEHQVKFLGFVPDEQLPSLLTSADIFIMPSEAELLSIATLEAMGCEKPILAARAGALPELVTEGENGYLFQAGNPTSAAHYMALLADRPDQWERMGKASRKKAEPHHITNVIQAYQNVYLNLLRNQEQQHDTILKNKPAITN